MSVRRAGRAELAEKIADLFCEEAVGIPWEWEDVVPLGGGDDPCLGGWGGAVRCHHLDENAFVEAAFEFVELPEGIHGNAGAEQAEGDGIRRGGDEAWVGSIADGADFPSVGCGWHGGAECSCDRLPDGVRHERTVDEEIHGGESLRVGAGIQCNLRGAEERACSGARGRCSLPS